MKAKADNKTEYVPTALRQVWEWKDAIYRETKHLPRREALREIMKRAHEVAVAQGFVPAKPANVAEAKARYSAKPRKRAADHADERR